MIVESSELILFVVGLLMSGFFSGSEAALMSISVNRTKQLIEMGGARGRALDFLSQRPNDILTTILIGNNIVNIYVSALTSTIANRYFESESIAVSVGIATLLILFFGEIIPKTFARNQAEKLALPVIRILQVFYYLLWPFIKMFMVIIQTVLGQNIELQGRVTTSRDIEFMVNKADEEKSIDSKQIDLLNSILEFPKIKVKDIMVPRLDVHGIKAGADFEQVIELIREVGHSRYPVFEEDLDQVVGFLHVKDLAYVTETERENFKVESYLKEPFFVYEHMKIQSVFDHMNRKKVHLALVKDENDLVVGIVTLEDIMEEIFGEIQDEHDDEEDGIAKLEQDENTDGLTVPGDLSLRDLYNEYDIKIPLNDNYSTLNGFLLDTLGNNFPEDNQIIIWEGLSFELSKVEDSRILEVTIKDIKGDRVFSASTPSSDESTKVIRVPSEDIENSKDD